MAVETATTIAGLNALWPLGSDAKAEGDDHIRLIKSVLKTDPITQATALPRSRIVNGAMQISQENVNVGSGAGSGLAWFSADQWAGTSSIAPGTASTVRIQSVTPNGSKDRIRMVVGTAKAALAAGDYLNFEQRIEGIRIADFKWGAAGARQVILRFGFKAPAGTYSVALQSMPTPPVRSYVANFTITAGQANTDTEQALAIPGDTAGTWLTDSSGAMLIRINMAAGSTYQGVAGWQGAGGYFATSANTNGMATAGNEFQLFDVGLYLDPDATGRAPQWQMPDEAEELRACQRYWEKNAGQGNCTRWSGNVTSAGSYSISAYFLVGKRSAPAVTLTHLSSSGFAATSGTTAADQGGLYEVRSATTTGNAAYFNSNWIANARM